MSRDLWFTKHFQILPLESSQQCHSGEDHFYSYFTGLETKSSVSLTGSPKVMLLANAGGNPEIQDFWLQIPFSFNTITPVNGPHATREGRTVHLLLGSWDFPPTRRLLFSRTGVLREERDYRGPHTCGGERTDSVANSIGSGLVCTTVLPRCDMCFNDPESSQVFPPALCGNWATCNLTGLEIEGPGGLPRSYRIRGDSANKEPPASKSGSGRWRWSMSWTRNVKSDTHGDAAQIKEGLLLLS